MISVRVRLREFCLRFIRDVLRLNDRSFQVLSQEQYKTGGATNYFESISKNNHLWKYINYFQE